MPPELDTFIARSHRRCEAALETLLTAPSSRARPGCDLLETLDSACRYSLLGGGKRVRPLLVYAAAESIEPDCQSPALDHVACAIEMVHVYSLVHDDLPAMDDDDLRRGKPSCHRAYDEATAILVGDGLQARAFELLAQAPDLDDTQRVAMLRNLANGAGPGGMVGGQAIDIAAIDRELSLEELRTMHSLKTGALIRSSLALGGIAAGAGSSQLAALDAYGEHIGLAFQVVDDILDEEGDTRTLGKTGGKDKASNKPTYVRLLGLDGARQEAAVLLEQALKSLNVFGDSADRLRELAVYIVERSS